LEKGRGGIWYAPVEPQKRGKKLARMEGKRKKVSYRQERASGGGGVKITARGERVGDHYEWWAKKKKGGGEGTL